MAADVALILLASGFAATLLLQWMALGLARRWQLVAQPNARSSHQQPTPTGGGVAFVVPLLIYLGWLAVAGSTLALALAVASGLVAAVGLWDDVRELGAAPRLAVQALAAAGVLWAAMPELWVGWLLVLGFALVWHVNLFNFMDGIDGLAAAQVLVYVVGAQIIALGVPGWSGDLLWLLGGCMVAFLAFNWAPARVFMGDVGSGFLGLLTGALAIVLWRQQALGLIPSLILFCGFWLDATYTLIVRMFTSQHVTQAHRSHLYQRVAARRGHSWTTFSYLLYATFWLLPLAWLCARTAPESILTASVWLLPAALPLLYLAWRLAAGLPNPRSDESHD